MACGLVGCVGETSTDETGAGSAELAVCLETMSVEDCMAVPNSGGCFVTGIGHIGDESNHPGAGRADQDSFGGNAMGMRDGTVRGEWQNTTHTGDSGEGPEVPRAIPNNAEWGGPGKWNHEEGYTFVVHSQDRREGGHHADFYSIAVMDSSGAVIYSEGDLIDGGNFQIHPPNSGHPYIVDPSP
jgi:hypothetical protein